MRVLEVYLCIFLGIVGQAKGGNHAVFLLLAVDADGADTILALTHLNGYLFVIIL